MCLGKKANRKQNEKCLLNKEWVFKKNKLWQNNENMSKNIEKEWINKYVCKMSLGIEKKMMKNSIE